MNALKPYKNRVQAGRQLGLALRGVGDAPGTLLLGLPRGGVPVAFAAAQQLHLPLDILLVTKLGMPGQEEFAIGAIGSGEVRVLEAEALACAGLGPDALDAMCAAATSELDRRERRYRAGRPPLQLRGRSVVLVDDGIATGASMRAAIAVADAAEAARIVVAAPVGAPDSCAALAPFVSAVVCPLQPPSFHAVGQWYRDFTQTTDDEVQDLLSSHERLSHHR